MRGILGPEVIAEMLSREGGIAALKEAKGKKGVAGLLHFTNMLGDAGFKGLATGFDTQFAEANVTGKKGMMFAFRNMFRDGGVFSDQMMDAFEGATGPRVKAGPARMPVGFSQRQTYYAGQQAAARGRGASARLTTGLGALSRRGAAESLDNRLATASVSATQFGEGLINAKRLLEEDRILKEKNLAIDKANLQVKEQLAIATAKAEETFMDNLRKSDAIGTPEKEAIKKRMATLRDDPMLANIVRTQLEGEEILSAQDKLLLEFLRTTMSQEADLRSKSATTIGEVNASYDANKIAVDKNTKSQIDLFKESQKFQFAQRIGRLRVDANKATNEVGGLAAMQQGRAPGFPGVRFGVTNQDIAGAAQAGRMARWRAGQGNLDPSATFRESFAYGGGDAALEFETGMKDVAQGMKSSFADAFQSIASGASSVKGAFANMAQSILNSISSISANMFSNMLFSSFGNKSIAGYAGGGLVTGGSGFADDVMTRMQGGEFVVKKSAVNKIGLPALNAINGAPGYANGGGAWSGMSGAGKMGAISAGTAALSGLIGSAMQPKQPGGPPAQDYGHGRGQYGYFGGPDPDAGQTDRVSGGRGAASVSLAKGFVYYRRDPATGRLVSERSRPTEGRFEVSSSLSLLGRLNEGDPQTGRMFNKEQTMARYQDYLATETQSRKDQINAVKKQKKQRLIGAYMNAAMLIGGAKLFGPKAMGPDVAGPGGQTYEAFQGSGGEAYRLKNMGFGNQGYGTGTGSSLMSGTAPASWWNNSVTSSPGSLDMLRGMGAGIGADTGYNRPVSLDHPVFKNPPGQANGGLARVMGGEYVMSPQAVRTHGVGFMTELNRGNVPGYADGGFVGGGPTLNTGGNTTNNVKINVNIDKNGKPEVQSQATADTSGPSERGDQQEAQDNAKFGELLQNVVIEEIVKQQRPGGLLQGSPHTP